MWSHSCLKLQHIPYSIQGSTDPLWSRIDTVYLLPLLYWDVYSSLTMQMMPALQTHRREALHISIINVHTRLKMQTMSDLTLRSNRFACVCCVKWCQSPVILQACACVIIQHAALQIHTYVHDCAHTQSHTDALRGQREGEPWPLEKQINGSGYRPANAVEGKCFWSA